MVHRKANQRTCRCRVLHLKIERGPVIKRIADPTTPIHACGWIGAPDIGVQSPSISQHKFSAKTFAKGLFRQFVRHLARNGQRGVCLVVEMLCVAELVSQARAELAPLTKRKTSLARCPTSSFKLFVHAAA